MIALFWVLSIAVVLIITTFVEKESGVWATIWTLTGAVAINYIWHNVLLYSIVSHPAGALGWVAIYVSIGAVWGLIKWYLYVNKRARAYESLKASYMKLKDLTSFNPETAYKFGRWLQENHWVNRDAWEASTAREHKGDIIRWMTYWPFSVLGSVIGDVILELWNILYSYMSGTYDRISQSIFKSAIDDHKLAKQYTPTSHPQ